MAFGWDSVCTGAGSCVRWLVGQRILVEIRRLIREMSLANRLWRAPAFVANCSSSTLRSRSLLLPNTWRRAGEGRPG